MQKKPQLIHKQGYPEQQERYPPEPQLLYEAFPSNNNQVPYSGNFQDHMYPQPRNTDPRRTNKSRNENRSPQNNNQENQATNSIYKRYSNNPDGTLNDDENYQDFRESEPRQEKFREGFQQSATSNFFPQENAVKALEEQYQFVCHQNEELKKQIALLKVSMYNETLTNEEQRVYIEILKQALETKIDENGLLGFLKSMNQRSNGSNGSEADLFIELTNMRSEMEALERDKALNDERIGDLYQQVEQLSTINEKLKQERNKAGADYEKLAKDMQRVLENLQLLKDENDKLNQEKDSLLDYIEELRGRLDQLEQENRAYNEELQAYDNKYVQLRNDEENNEEFIDSQRRRQGTELDDVIEVDEGNDANSQDQYEEAKRSQAPMQKKLSKRETGSIEFENKRTEIMNNEIIQHTQQSNEDVDQQNYNIREEELIEENQNLRINYERLGQQVVDLKQAYEEQNEKFEKANEITNKLINEKQECLKDLEKLREQNAKFELMIQQYQEQIESLSHQTTQHQEDFQKIETLEQNNSELEKEINRYKELVEETRVKNEKDRQAKAEEIKALYQQTSDLRIELRDLKENYQRLKTERDSFETNIRDLKDELDKRQKTIISHLKEVNDLKQLSEEKQEQLDLKVSQIERFETQVNELNRFVEECDEKVKLAYEAEGKLTRDLDSLTKENKRIKEENKELKQRFDKNQREVEQTKQILSEIIKTISGEVLSSENLETSLIGFNEKIKGLKRSEDSNKKRVYEIEQQNNILKDEINRLEERNKKMSKNETETYAENRKLRSELEQLQDEINNQQIKNDKIKEEFERLQHDFNKRRKDDDQSFKEKAKYLEDKVTRLITEKSSLEYVMARYREVTLNGEINDLIDEAKVAHTQISYLDKDKLDLQVRLDVIKNKEKLSKRGSPIKLNETANKRTIEEVKEGLAEVDVNMEIYATKKQSIEKELMRLMEKEREKHFGYFEFERQNYQLKAELELMTKENQLIEQTRDTLEASYNDLVKEIRRSRIEDRLNASLYSPGERGSYTRKTFSPGEHGTYSRKTYYGKPELEKTKDQDLGSHSKDSARRELENTGYLSSKTSSKYISNEENAIQKHNTK